MYSWQQNQNPDPNLDFHYDLEELSEKIFYLQNPWILNQSNFRILVTGAYNWLGHYILHILTENIGIAEILAIDAKKDLHIYPRKGIKK